MSTATGTEFPHSTADVAAKLGVTSRTVTNRAKAIGVGIEVKGKAGFRFSDRDIEALVASLRPAPATPVIRRRRRTRGVPA